MIMKLILHVDISDNLSLSQVKVTVPTTSTFLYFFYLLLLLG